jgi:hypothetical protein
MARVSARALIPGIAVLLLACGGDDDSSGPEFPNVSFSVGAPSGGSSSWTFTGAVTTSGVAGGRHTLRGVCGACPGSWTAAK